MLVWIFLALEILLLVALVVMLCTKFLDKERVFKSIKPITIFRLTSVVFIILPVVILIFTAVDDLRKTSSHIETRYSLSEEYPLHGMDSSNTVNGSGAGYAGFAYMSIGTDETYQLLYETADGGYQKVTIPAESTTIHEIEAESEDTPRLEVWSSSEIRVTTTNETALLFTRPFWRDIKPVFEEEKPITLFPGPTIYKVYIPADSIVQSFDVMK